MLQLRNENKLLKKHMKSLYKKTQDVYVGMKGLETLRLHRGSKFSSVSAGLSEASDTETIRVSTQKHSSRKTQKPSSGHTIQKDNTVKPHNRYHTQIEIEFDKSNKDGEEWEQRHAARARKQFRQLLHWRDHHVTQCRLRVNKLCVIFSHFPGLR